MPQREDSEEFRGRRRPRPAAEIAREPGIPRNRFYKWQKEVAARGGAFPGSGRQAEPAAELARLKRELAGVTEERTFKKKPRCTVPRSRSEVQVHPGPCARISGGPLVSGLAGQSQRVLCLVRAAR